MIRRRFSIADAYRDDVEEFESSPMESIANISDVMLALVAHWGVNMTDIAQINESQMQPIDADVSSTVSAEAAGGSQGYEEVGTVYKDKETGQMYVVG